MEGATTEPSVAVVVGSAVGIGEAVVERLAVDGIRVVAADLDDSVDEIARHHRRSGRQVVAREVDVRDDGSVTSLMDVTFAEFGRLDLLVNTVAAPARSPGDGDGDVVEIDLEAWDEALRVNVGGMLLGCRRAIPHMLTGGGGAIVNVSSISGIVGDPRRVGYSASKAAILGLTRHVARRWGKEGIRCNALLPGVTLTPRARRSLPEDQIRQVLEATPSPRLAESSDVASIVAFLLRDEAYYIQGQAIVADGGATTATLR